MAAWSHFVGSFGLQGEWWVCCGTANVFHLGLLCWKMNLVPTYLTTVFNGQVTFCCGLVVVYGSKNESTIKVKTSSQLSILYSYFFSKELFFQLQNFHKFFLRCLYLHSRWLCSTQVTYPFCYQKCPASNGRWVGILRFETLTVEPKGDAAMTEKDLFPVMVNLKMGINSMGKIHLWSFRFRLFKKSSLWKNMCVLTMRK